MKTTKTERKTIFYVLLLGILLSGIGEAGLLLDAIFSGHWWVYMLVFCQLFGFGLIGLWVFIRKSMSK